MTALKALLLITLALFTFDAMAANELAYSLIARLPSGVRAAPYSAPSALAQVGVVYQAMPSNVNWQRGYTTVVVGMRMAATPAATFVQKISRHVGLVRSSFQPLGLNGYVFYVTGDYEIAYQNWVSKEAAQAAFGTTAGQAILTDVNSFMQVLLFEEAHDFFWLHNIRY